MKARAGVCLIAFAAAAWGQEKRGDGVVVLPVNEYQALREKAYPAPRPSAPPPVEATLTRVDYDLHVGRDAATGEARLTVDVLKEGWVRVPLPAGLLVREARLEGRPVPFLGEEVLLGRTGRAVLSLEVAVPVTAQAGLESLTLPTGRAAVSRAALAVARQGVEVSAAGGLIVERREAAGESRVVAHGQPGAPLVLSWRARREDPRAAQPLRLRSRTVQIVGLGEESAQVSAEVGLEIVQGRAESVTLAVPAGLSVNDVSGAQVADWDAREGGLTVRFLEPVTGSVQLTLAAEGPVPHDGDIAVPLLRIPASEREAGGVAVEVLGPGEITRQQAEGLLAADASDLGPAVANRASPALAAYRLEARPGRAPRRLVVSVARFATEAALLANIEEARYRALLSDDGKALVQARYAVRNGQRSFLAVDLPQGASLWSAAVEGRPVRPGHAEGGALLVPLRVSRARVEPDAPAFLVELTYLARGTPWVERGQAAVALPRLDLPVSRTGLLLVHSPRFEATFQGAAFHAEPFTPPSSEALRTVSAAPPQPPPAPPPAGAGEREAKDEAGQERDALVAQLHSESRGARVAGILPVQAAFPELGGPWLFLAAELTPPDTLPELALVYKRSDRN
ncbi:MAG TPA: hypothetical protein VF310_07675 [Vicinamibacteria bacterium]